VREKNYIMADTIKRTEKRVWVGLGLGGLTDGQQVVAMSPFSLLALNLLCLFLDWSKQCNLILGNLQYDRKKCIVVPVVVEHSGMGGNTSTQQSAVCVARSTKCVPMVRAPQHNYATTSFPRRDPAASKLALICGMNLGGIPFFSAVCHQPNHAYSWPFGPGTTGQPKHGTK